MLERLWRVILLFRERKPSSRVSHSCCNHDYAQNPSMSDIGIFTSYTGDSQDAARTAMILRYET